jgi:hypothetical protein
VKGGTAGENLVGMLAHTLTRKIPAEVDGAWGWGLGGVGGDFVMNLSLEGV